MLANTIVATMLGSGRIGSENGCFGRSVAVRSLFGRRKRALSPQAKTLAYYRTYKTEYATMVAGYMDDAYLHTPRVLSIESYVKCNATCTFCPYPTSTRIGEKMDIALIQKIIDDISEAERQPQYFVPSRLNEPMLDKRMLDVCGYAAVKLPETRLAHFTNGPTLNDRNLSQIVAVGTLGFINVSLNDHRAEQHYRRMGISFDLVIRNLRMLHSEHERMSATWPVYLTRAGDGSEDDLAFKDWCANEFPRFSARTNPQFDWLGKTDELDLGRAPEGCTQWYALNFLADGREALCCIDDDGRYGRGNVRDEHALNIYNHPTRMRIRVEKTRLAHDGCKSCSALL